LLGADNQIQSYRLAKLLEEFSLIQEYNSYAVVEVMKKKKFKNIPDTNVIKLAIQELHGIFMEYKSINSIAHFLEGWKEDEQKKFSFTPAQKIVFDNLLGSNYHAEDSEWLIIAEALG
jgi:hypothetical protein